MFEPYGEKPNTYEVHNDFDVFQEMARADLQAGGQAAEDWWIGYSLGIRFMIYLIAAFYAYAMLKEFLESGGF